MATELSKDLLDQALMVSGHHAIDTGAYTREMVGRLDGEQRRCLGLLEAIDYDCFSYSAQDKGKDSRGMYCLNLGQHTIEEVEQYLIEHKHIISSLPDLPSTLGTVLGTFNFLNRGAE